MCIFYTKREGESVRACAQAKRALSFIILKNELRRRFTWNS